MSNNDAGQKVTKRLIIYPITHVDRVFLRLTIFTLQHEEKSKLQLIKDPKFFKYKSQIRYLYYLNPILRGLFYQRIFPGVGRAKMSPPI